MVYSLFFFNHTATTEIYTLSLHDALPISRGSPSRRVRRSSVWRQPSSVTSIRARHHGLFPGAPQAQRSEEHTSELQSRFDLVCRLLLEKKKNKRTYTIHNTKICFTHIKKV